MSKVCGICTDDRPKALEICKKTHPESIRYEGERTITFTKVAGVSFEGRQEHVKDLKLGEELMLSREPDNPYDAYAVAIHTHGIGTGDDSGGCHLGFVRAKSGLNIEVSKMLEEGKNVGARVTEITGGKDGRSLGVNIEIYEVEKNGK